MTENVTTDVVLEEVATAVATRANGFPCKPNKWARDIARAAITAYQKATQSPPSAQEDRQPAPSDAVEALPYEAEDFQEIQTILVRVKEVEAFPIGGRDFNVIVKFLEYALALAGVKPE